MKKIIRFFFITMLLLCSSYFLTTAQIKAHRFVVAKDGSGNFTTVQAAINAVPNFSKTPTIIYIKNGVYKENIILPSSKRMVHFMGENVDSTIITFDNYASKKNIFGENMGTSGSSTIYIYGNDFTAENITFQNSAGPVGQAVAVWVAGDKTQFKNCRFLGFQDTLYTYGRGSREYYSHCYIEGTTDFIFGSATCVFDSCTIFCKKGGRFVTAASTPDSVQYGYVFLHCNITGNAPPNSYFLGRPWRPYAKVVYLYCRLGDMIMPQGWSNWHDTHNNETAYYAEYQNRGPGFQPGQRVSWSHQLTSAQANEYTVANIFNNWAPNKNKENE